jgi:hypothetical protein
LGRSRRSERGWFEDSVSTTDCPDDVEHRADAGRFVQEPIAAFVCGPGRQGRVVSTGHEDDPGGGVPILESAGDFQAVGFPKPEVDQGYIGNPIAKIHRLVG